MSALDDLLSAIESSDDPLESVPSTKESRAELELLRAERELYKEAAFSWASVNCTGCTDHKHARHAKAQRILRTDTERARKMGLGWAL